MAGFFDTLGEYLTPEAKPEERDYSLQSELQSPEEQQAFRAGQETSHIPGLDYAKSMARGVGRELFDASMAPLGESYNQEMAAHQARQAAAEQARQQYPRAYRSGALHAAEEVPGAELPFLMQGSLAGAGSRLLAGRGPGAVARRSFMESPIEMGGEVPAATPAAAPGNWESIMGTSPLGGPHRTMPEPKPSIWPELKLNPHGVEEEVSVLPIVPRSSSSSSWGDVQASDMNPNVRAALMRAEQAGKPLTGREQNMVDTYFGSFKTRPNLDASPKAKVNLASPTMGIHGEAAADIDANIAARQAEQEAKDLRFARMPAVLQTNAFLKRANRLIEGAEEAQNFALGKGRNSNFYRAPDAMTLGMEEAAAYNPTFAPRQTLMDKALGISSKVDPMWVKGGLAAGSSLLGAHMLNEMRNKPSDQPGEKKILPDMNILKHKPSTGPTMEEGPLVSKTEKEAAPSKTTATVSRPSAGKASTSSHKNAPHRAAPHRAAPKRATKPAESNKRYWGDYRDVDPFASDPIGSFIDELTGQVKSAKKPGTLGDLGRAQGGMVRRPFAEGGADDRIPVLSDIGDAIGGMFQGGDQNVVAKDQQAAAPSGGGLSDVFERWQNNPLSQFLFATGIGAMASDRVNPLQAFGEGGLRGLEYMQAAQANLRDQREKERAAAQRLRNVNDLGKLFGGDEQPVEAPVETTEAPRKTSEVVTPETPQIAPKEVAGNEPAAPAPATTAPATTAPATTAPATTAPATTAPATTAPSTAEPVVAADGKLRRLENERSKVEKYLATHDLDPATRQQANTILAAKQREINEIRQKQKDAQAAADRARTEKRMAELAELRRREQDPKYITQKSRAEAGAKQVAEDEAQLANIDASVGTLDTMEKLAKQGIYSGMGVGSQAAAFVGQQDLPVGNWFLDKETSVRTNEFKRLADEMTYLAADKKLGGGTSNTDLTFIQNKGANLGLTTEGNLEAIKYMRRALERKQQIIGMEQDYIDKHGFLDSNFYRELKKWGKENPLFSDEEKRKAGILTTEKEGKTAGPSTEGTASIPAPSKPEEREIGKIYSNKNGDQARWTQHGWEKI